MRGWFPTGLRGRAGGLLVPLGADLLTNILILRFRVLASFS
jgi:hypothetical protein